MHNESLELVGKSPTRYPTLGMKLWSRFPRPVALFLWISVLRSLFALIEISFSMMFVVSQGSQGSRADPAGIVLQGFWIVFGTLSFINNVFLLSHDHSHTNTYVGSMMVQMIFSLLSIIGGIILIRLPGQLDDFPIPQGFMTAHVILEALIAVYFIILRTSKNLSSDFTKPWLVNSKDMLTGADYQLFKTSWIGIPRFSEDPVYESRGTFVAVGLASYLVKILFRRVNPVETRSYAFAQNIFALFSIAAIGVRAVTLTIQAQAQVFETHTNVEQCRWEDPYWRNIQLLVKHAGSTGPSPPVSLAYNFEVGVKSFSVGYRTFTTNISCPSSFVGVASPQNFWQKDTAVRNSTDWFEAFDCGPAIASVSENRTGYPNWFSNAIYTYSMRSLNGTPLDQISRPYIWLSADDPPNNNASLLTAVSPWLVRPWQPLPGQNTGVDMGLKRRDFIVSSFLRDTIGGRNPTFWRVWLFPLSSVQSTPLNDGLLSTGTIAPTTDFGYSTANSLQNIRNQKTTIPSLDMGCEVVQDYRASTAFDALGSIGGLLALLQGVHLLLFGKPMFWAIFGAKLISPFGLIGRLGSNKFQQRLRTYYYVPDSEIRNQQNNPADMIRVFAFLRDYVIDFGPADLTPRENSNHAALSVDMEEWAADDRLRYRGRQASTNSEMPLLPTHQTRPESMAHSDCAVEDTSTKND